MESTDASTQAHTLAATLMSQLGDAIALHDGPFVLGVSGLQGSGKSTLAAAIAALANERDGPAVVLSIDDVYLTRTERKALSRRVHPLLKTRGVPGTHDLPLLIDTLDRLPHASPDHPVALPRFDKGIDDRAPRDRWPLVTKAPRLIVLEGWCLGVTPEDEVSLATPVNDLERNEDVDASWRLWVNSRIDDYLPVWDRIDALALLLAPSWDVVRAWRGEAEEALHARGAPQAMDDVAMERFLQHYERVSKLALRVLPGMADVVVRLDGRRRPTFPA
ncbi:glycerate kinase [Luteibacter rhizovicinus]|uniref:Glycerate kinase n=1 Tax=Luteibacter rhizovicinus TaxID=242606 RepID=A0A4R3YGJ8_9GAMM|nr:kinase [Luteibacter rhizovicinus]TCV91306.1 glycerate kinase [Luteibacter rhizovicinus]